MSVQLIQKNRSTVQANFFARKNKSTFHYASKSALLLLTKNEDRSILRRCLLCQIFTQRRWSSIRRWLKHLIMAQETSLRRQINFFQQHQTLSKIEKHRGGCAKIIWKQFQVSFTAHLLLPQKTIAWQGFCTFGYWKSDRTLPSMSQRQSP